jgi:hypothetical protein
MRSLFTSRREALTFIGELAKAAASGQDPHRRLEEDFE